MMTLIDLVKTLFEQDRKRFLETMQKRDRRRIGEVAGLVVLDHILKFEVGALHLVGFARFDRLRARGHQREAGSNTVFALLLLGQFGACLM